MAQESNGFSGIILEQIRQSAFTQGCTGRSDGYRSYIPSPKGYTHEHKPYDPNSGLLHWLHVVISNAKAFILGTYHGLPKESLQFYLDEDSFRFSRRSFDLLSWNTLFWPLAHLSG